jgi:DNA polymerase lambda-like protein
MELVCINTGSRWTRPLHSLSPGQSTAYAWYFAGCRTLEDIKERKGGIKLSSVQVLGLKYYDGALSHSIQ